MQMAETVCRGLIIASGDLSMPVRWNYSPVWLHEFKNCEDIPLPLSRWSKAVISPIFPTAVELLPTGASPPLARSFAQPTLAPTGIGRPGARGTAYVAGTSFAAPMVSGGLAVMKQLFRDQLLNTALVTRLFATADKGGKFADQEIYGQGMMDLGAAATPVGFNNSRTASRSVRSTREIAPSGMPAFCAASDKTRAMAILE